MAEDCVYSDHSEEIEHHLLHSTGTIHGAGKRRPHQTVMEPRHSELPDAEPRGDSPVT